MAFAIHSQMEHQYLGREFKPAFPILWQHARHSVPLPWRGGAKRRGGSCNHDTFRKTHITRTTPSCFALLAIHPSKGGEHQSEHTATGGEPRCHRRGTPEWIHCHRGKNRTPIIKVPHDGNRNYGNRVMNAHSACASRNSLANPGLVRSGGLEPPRISPQHP